MTHLCRYDAPTVLDCILVQCTYCTMTTLVCCDVVGGLYLWCSPLCDSGASWAGTSRHSSYDIPPMISLLYHRSPPTCVTQVRAGQVPCGSARGQTDRGGGVGLCRIRAVWPASAGLAAERRLRLAGWLKPAQPSYQHRRAARRGSSRAPWRTSITWGWRTWSLTLT